MFLSHYPDSGSFCPHNRITGHSRSVSKGVQPMTCLTKVKAIEVFEQLSIRDRLKADLERYTYQAIADRIGCDKHVVARMGNHVTYRGIVKDRVVLL